MLRSVRTVLHGLWAVIAILLGVAIGAGYGWQAYGLVGALGFGLIGLVVGGLAALAPGLVLDILSALA
jgi:hypothetical protein